MNIIHCPRHEKMPDQMLQELKVVVQGVDHSRLRSSRLNLLRSAIQMVDDVNNLEQVKTAVRYLENDKKTQGHDPKNIDQTRKGDVSEKCVMM